MKKFLLLLFCCLLAIGCTDEIKRPIPKDSSRENGEAKVLAALLPVHIDSTNYLLHPVGEWARENEGYFSSGSSSGAGVYTASDGIRGNITNIRFQRLDENTFLPLTNKPFLISSIQFLRKIFENTGKGFLLYNVFDSDSNGDEELGAGDMQSLYISGIDGKNFKKLTAEDQSISEFIIIEKLNRVYFKTYKDVNKDNRLSEEDKVHLFYIDLSAVSPEVVEYDPSKSSK